jgi:hypothetical protein
VAVCVSWAATWIGNNTRLVQNRRAESMDFIEEAPFFI